MAGREADSDRAIRINSAGLTACQRTRGVDCLPVGQNFFAIGRFKIVGEPEYWGVKTLTFRIKKNRKAHFAMLRIDAPPAAVVEMERLERINEDVIRFLTVRVDQHDEGPSIMLQKRDRDERRSRRDRGEGEFDAPEGVVEEVAEEVAP